MNTFTDARPATAQQNDKIPFSRTELINALAQKLRPQVFGAHPGELDIMLTDYGVEETKKTKSMHISMLVKAHDMRGNVITEQPLACQTKRTAQAFELVDLLFNPQLHGGFSAGARQARVWHGLWQTCVGQMADTLVQHLVVPSKK